VFVGCEHNDEFEEEAEEKFATAGESVSDQSCSR
jgi:hypothetical protein